MVINLWKLLKLNFKLPKLVFKNLKLVSKMQKLRSPAFPLQVLGWKSHKKFAWTDANLDCGFVENELVFVVSNIGRPGPPIALPLRTPVWTHPVDSQLCKESGVPRARGESDTRRVEKDGGKWSSPASSGLHLWRHQCSLGPRRLSEDSGQVHHWQSRRDIC